MTKAKELSREIKIRVNNLDTLKMLQTLLDSGKKKYANYNRAINNILEDTLPIILKDLNSDAYIKEQTLQSINVLQKNIDKRLDVVERQLNKVIFSSLINQEMNTLLVNLVEQIFEQQIGTSVSESMRGQLIKNVPEPLKLHLKEYIMLEARKNIEN